MTVRADDASDLTIGLSTPKGEVPFTISTGASSTLEAPVGVQYRVTTTGGLNSITGTQETAGYAAVRDGLTITIGARGIPRAPSLFGRERLTLYPALGAAQRETSANTPTSSAMKLTPLKNAHQTRTSPLPYIIFLPPGRIVRCGSNAH